MEALPPDELRLLTSSGKPIHSKRSTVLFRQGSYPKSVVWLMSGKVKIFQETHRGQRQTLYIYSDGDLLGYRPLISDEVHPVTAVLLEDSTYMLIPGEVFRGLLLSSPFF